MSADQSDESVKNKELELIPKWFTQAIALVLILAAGMLVAYVGEFGISLSGRQDVWGQFGDFWRSFESYIEFHGIDCSFN